jgi:chromate reductase
VSGVRVVAISGSLQSDSTNSALLRRLADTTASIGLVIWEDLGRLPHFRPGDDGNDAVAALRKAVGSAALVVIATPEYAGGMPGVLKNALDWLVGSGELYGKPVVVLSVAPSPDRGHNARRWVAEVVEKQGGVVRDSFTVPLLRSAAPEEVAAAVELSRSRIGAALR